MNVASIPISPKHVRNRFYQVLTNVSSRYLLLQGLVSIILSYELMFSGGFALGPITNHGLAAGLWIGVAILALLPETVLGTTWFTTVLVVVDTILVTTVVYLSGNARPDLYVTYFVLMLVAASVRRLTHMMGLALLLSLGYGVVLYEGILQSGTIETGHLLGVPILLVMAVFYGLAVETTAVVQEEKSVLIKDVESLKQTERDLQEAKIQLEERIQKLRQELSRANADLLDGQVMRQGLERQLQDALKMEAVGRVATRIAGEFGSLFSVIGKQTGVMLSRFSQDDPLRASADELFKAGEQAATLTAQLIALNLDDRQVRIVLSVQEVLSDLQHLIAGLLPDPIALNVQADQVAIYIEVDREGLENVLLQLAVNARDAMPNGGQLSLTIRLVQEPVPLIRALPPGLTYPQVMIQIVDTGTGMNLDTQAHMFEPLFSTKETNVGLGLTAVYGIVKQNGGTVEVESRPGQGTTVRVFFPAVPAPQVQEDTTPKALLAKGNETILLIEEDEIERKLACMALLRYRYRVLEAASPVEALMLTQQYEGAVHLAVSPLVMPEMGGRELARRLLSHHPMLKALFVSGYDGDTIHHHRINQRFVLQHPYRQTGLLEKVREVLDAA